MPHYNAIAIVYSFMLSVDLNTGLHTGGISSVCSRSMSGASQTLHLASIPLHYLTSGELTVSFKIT